MNTITLVIELHDEDVGGLADIVGSPNVVEWCWGNAVTDAAGLRGTVIDLLNARKVVQDDGLN